jgi:ElaA protein
LNRQVDVSGVVWRCRPFGELSATELYALLQLRAEVFVVEQACVFQDIDGRDDQALHLLGEAPDDAGRTQLLAYARLLPAGTTFPEASIGRVVTASSTRGSGLGHTLMQQAIQVLHQTWGPQAIRIGAQAHLQAFYARLGFEPEGAIYLEDGIDHIEMLKK